MKPRSVISIIIAGVLILCGIVVCIVSSVIAKNNDVMIFPEKNSDGELVYKCEISDSPKINISAVDSDVYIIGGEEKSYIEIVNFNANYYKLNDSNGIITFAQVDDFFSMFKFWENGFSFKGMRYLLRFGDDSDGGRKVIVHLKDDTSADRITVTTNDAEIKITNCDFNADYNITANNCKVSFDNVKTASQLSIKNKSGSIGFSDNEIFSAVITSSDETDILIENSVLDSLSASFESGSLEINGCESQLINVSTQSGNITATNCKTVESLFDVASGSMTLNNRDEAIKINVVSGGGLVSVDGKFIDNYSRNDKEAKYAYDIRLTDGNLTINNK